MAPRLFGADPALARLVDQQMRNWELASRQRRARPATRGDEVEEFICVSRQVGVDATAVVERLHDRLGWPVFDRGILEVMAGDNEAQRRIYASMDQRDMGWWEETLRSLMDSEFVRNDYFHRLCRTVLSLARQGRCIFLGRGADLILPRCCGLRVRLVAPLEERVAHWAEEGGLEPKAARREVARIEKERASYIRRHFGVDADDPLRADLVLNLGRLDAARAADLILAALPARARAAGAGRA